MRKSLLGVAACRHACYGLQGRSHRPARMRCLSSTVHVRRRQWGPVIGIGIGATVLSVASLSVFRYPGAGPRTIHSDSQMDDDEKTKKQIVDENAEKTKQDAGWSLSSWSTPNLHISMPSLPSFPAPSFDLPNWAWPESLISFRTTVNELLLELSGGEGSLYHKVTTTPPDLSVHPECEWDAEVRLGEELSLSERAFLNMRKRYMRTTLAKLFDVPVEEIDERDIPILAIAGSGGGLRAMVNTAGALNTLKDAGILDCTTYVAGISGSCWSLGALYSGVAGLDKGVPSTALTERHLQSRITVPYVDSSALELLTTKPTNMYLLSGLIQKAILPLSAVSLTDLYGTLISSRILVPENLEANTIDGTLDPRFLSLHGFRRFIDNGALPMPIFTAVSRHLPANLDKEEDAIRKEKSVSVDEGRSQRLDLRKSRIEEEARWLWFEFTPYETGCDELGAWIPSWSLGRQFTAGKSSDRTPEISFSILSGIFASAFCASLQHYFKEVQPVLRQLPAGLYGWLSKIIEENETEFDALHAIVPNALPNYVKGLDGQLRAGSPSQITEPDTLGFMDAGAELNIPYYPLFRRNVDCVIALDASADSHSLWFTRAEEFALKRGLSTWPKGAKWPAAVEPDGSVSTPALAPESTESTDESMSAGESANRKIAEAQEGQIVGQQKKQQQTEERNIPSSPRPSSDSSNDDPKNQPVTTSASKPTSTSDTEPMPNQRLADNSPAAGTSSAHLWIGSTGESEALSSSNAEELTEEKLAAHDGIGIIYLPLVSNPAVPDFDPLSISTWRFDLQESESDKLLKVARANVQSSEEMMVKVLKAMWLRKKRAREGKQ